jgi:hypothetical protein
VREEGLPPIKKTTIEDQAKKLGIKRKVSKEIPDEDILAKEELQEFETKLQGIVDHVIIEMPLPDLEGAATDPIQYRLKEEEAVKAIAEKLVVLHAAYVDFTEDHPWIAEKGLTAFNVALQTLIAGPVGFGNAVRGELTGDVINLVAGEHIAAGANAAIEAGAEQLMSRYSSLDKEEARILVAGTAIITAGIAEGSAGMKQILHSVNAKKAAKVEFSHNSVESFDYTNVGKVNAALHKKHRVENFEWADDYNNWLLNVDPSKVQRHHVFSNKNSAIKESRLFKEGLLNEKILSNDRNIIVLPKKDGLHPTMNKHPGGAHLKRHTNTMIDELNKIHNEYQNKIITKDQIEPRYWKAVNQEKDNLYHGRSELYNNDLKR